MDNIWINILSNAGVAAIVSSFASYLINIFAQKHKYKDDYYKMVVKKRMDAYQYIETQIQVLKLTVVDNIDAKPYFMMFSGDRKMFFEGQTNLALVASNSLWLSEEMTDKLRQLQQDFLTIEAKITDNPDNNIRIGKEWYTKLGEDRRIIENCLKKDLLSLYNVKSFLKAKTEHRTVIMEIPKTNK